jgi:hypothetical protein
MDDLRNKNNICSKNKMLSRRMLSNKTTASPAAENGVKMPPAMEKRCKEMSERRRLVEQARSMSVRRIQQDIQRIAQREMEYAERLLSEYAPVKLSLNDSAWSTWQDFLPIRLEFVEKTTPETAAAPEESSEVSSEAPIA